MLWLILSLTSALFWSFYHLGSRYVLKDANPRYLTYGVHILLCILFLPVVIFFWDIFVVDLKVFLLLCFLGLELATSEFFYMASLKHGEIGKTVPLLSITPIFTLIIAFFLFSELPSLIGIAGILLIVAGVYVLNMERINENIFEPFKAVITHKGPRYMLIVALLYGLGSVVDKYTIVSSNVWTRLILYAYFVFFFQTIILLAMDKKHYIIETKKILKSKYLWIFVLIFFSMVLQLVQFYALTMTYAAYVISIKRTAALFSVILAYFIFKEKRHFLTNLIGTVMMVGGAILMVL